ncbi:hypothetical protein BCV72DRAFT_304610 [Rhizopus microsporus var. microsporus]|uniref:Uncharacterized protein n=2 Tax=Rhizopus microsporus TaxID=58291 RepID=A0A2G4SYP8_RHIZD|nr:uncharacterized protein RHIMIDRAFT_235862 [Rhizopus microsporus ATCC 52813]ORE07411.1 hypothetical protein BCV72DRAFT_304610 [Rhizopus microsporus var. microsporus]PHZ13867.1 hypothetical protein RHIMIDRAFT_235862 [Rhizopus microsporus ATCC 52813]
MSFKAKQRAKHGHLFGDGKYPLNAALVSSTDDPLFAPTKSSQSTRTSSPVKVDPLSRNDIDSSSSTPLFSRRTKADSIFGDIDVSKLGRRSPNSLRSNKPLEEDEDLFGGMRRAPKKPPSIESNGNSMRKQQPVKITTTTTKPLVQPSSPVKVSTNPPSPAKTPTPPTPPTPIKPSVEDTKSSSFFASASRFFKSSSSTKPSASTSTSSSVSSDIQNQPVSPSVTLPSPSSVDKTVASVQQQQQQQTEPPQLQVVNRQVEEEEEEEENDTNDATPVIEDEATRAFADETISFSTHAINYTTSLTPDLLIDGIDSLKVRTPLSPSVSSPTHTTTTAGGVELDPWALSISLEPSVSSPITRVPVQEIEPQKRRVFADLITSWNTGQIHREREEVDPDQFFHHIAEEQRDVGFAGISNDSPIKTVPTSVNIWEEVENPWS